MTLSREFSIPVTSALMAVTLVYLWGWYQLRKSLPNLVPAWRLSAFVSGVFLVWAAVGSPFSALDHHLLTAHMTQHLLLMTVAAPLILLGAPAIALLHGLPEFLVRWGLRPVLRCRAVHALGGTLAHPVFCWLASAFVVIGWHVPFLFEQGMQSAAWHDVEQACFLAAGILFWWPVLQPWPSLVEQPRWGIPVYLFLATLPCDALAAFLTFCDRVIYRHYLSPHRFWGISPFADQECAGALMWIWVMFAYLIPAAVVTLQMLSRERQTSRVEAV